MQRESKWFLALAVLVMPDVTTKAEFTSLLRSKRGLVECAIRQNGCLEALAHSSTRPSQVSDVKVHPVKFGAGGRRSSDSGAPGLQ